ncbi:glycosyl hydrolase family 61-domain-containing protein [Lentinula raphanica]|nr:glycosyl hydrolase family 61-domain-containing protein [Lentinula raphanica]
MNSGAPANVTIPSNIAPGNYLIRHKLFALQIAQTEGGAEFYPACVQVSIGGEGTGTLMDEELVQLPGAYSDTDPGILVCNVLPYALAGRSRRLLESMCL